MTSITSRAGKDRAARAAKGHAGELVDYGQDPQGPAVLGARVGEVVAPDVVAALGHKPRGASVLKARGATS